MQTLQVDGQELPLASLLKKGTAIGIDLSLAVAAASVLFGAVSLFVPLDDDAAKAPVGVIVLAAIGYLVWGRDRYFSVGRRLLRLKLVKIYGAGGGRLSMIFGRSVSVHVDPVPPKDTDALIYAVCLIGFATTAAAFALSAALSSTHAFETVRTYVAQYPAVTSRDGQEGELSSLPRVLLLGKQRGFIQVGVSWGESNDVLDVHLTRNRDGWKVVSVAPAETRMLGNYSLGAPEGDIPPPPKQ